MTALGVVIAGAGADAPDGEASRRTYGLGWRSQRSSGPRTWFRKLVSGRDGSRSNASAPGSGDGVRQVQATSEEASQPPAAPDPPASAALDSTTSQPSEVFDPAESRAVEEGQPGVTSEGAPREKTKGTSDLGPGVLNKFLGLEESPVVVYGWLENSFTGNTNGTPQNRQNFSVFPNRMANEWQGNQYYLVVENPVETGDEANLGFRLDGFLGNDWQFSKMYGLFDRAFTPNSFPGVDFPQFYGEAHLPILTEGGIEIKGGRFYSPAGYESVMATQRPLLSVPNLFNFTPFTLFGMLTTLHLSDRVIMHNGAVNGWDRWIDQNYKWNYVGGFHWTSEDGKTFLKSHVIVGPNQLPRFAPVDSPFLPTGVITNERLQRRNNPNYADHFRTYNSTVLTHKWTDKFTQTAETFFAVEEHVPGLGKDGRPRDSAWYGFAHWWLYEFDPKVTGVWRFEVFRDEAGAAIGVADWFYETTLGLILKPEPWLWIRPEARYDWAQFKKPYSDGTRGSQLTLAFDVILLY